MTTIIQKEPGLPPCKYSGHVECVLARPVPAKPRWGLVIAGAAVALAWLWVCAYGELFV